MVKAVIFWFPEIFGGRSLTCSLTFKRNCILKSAGHLVDVLLSLGGKEQTVLGATTSKNAMAFSTANITVSCITHFDPAIVKHRIVPRVVERYLFLPECIQYALPKQRQRD